MIYMRLHGRKQVVLIQASRTLLLALRYIFVSFYNGWTSFIIEFHCFCIADLSSITFFIKNKLLIRSVLVQCINVTSIKMHKFNNYT